MSALTDLPQLGDLSAMEEDVYRWCVAKGWYAEAPDDQDGDGFDEHMDLLHSEGGEASDAYRRWGTEDATDLFDEMMGSQTLPKPEGVGSEFADILIRMLDDSRRHGLNLPARFARHDGRYGLRRTFLARMNTFHILVARVSMARETASTPEDSAEVEDMFAGVLVYLLQLCDVYSIDLQAEYDRKMAYNWTRAYRHGGKRL